MKKRIAILLIVVLSLSIVLPACSPASTEAPEVEATEVPEVDEPEVEEPEVEEPEVEEPVILRIGRLIDIDCWNPFLCTNIYGLGTYILEGLTGRGSLESGCAGIPELAESWEVSEDGRTWTIKLHEGITFSNGEPYTAETAKWNIEYYANSPSLSGWFAETWDLQDVTVIDELTFSYTTADPIVNSPDYDWVWWLQLPPSVWGDVAEAELFMFDNYPPIGTGPFVLTEHVPGSHIIFDAREDYYRGKPEIDRVVHTIYSNPDAIVNALIAGEIDLTTPYMPPETYDVLMSDPNITVEEKEPYAGVAHLLHFNVYEGGSKHPAIEDPAVREAIDYAINKQQIVDVALFGHGTVLPTGWIGLTDVELNPEIEVTPYDPVMANQILEEAGYIDTDGDGIRETTEGEALNLRFLYMLEFPVASTIADFISDWLGAVGIEVNVEAHEFGTATSLLLSERDYDMALVSDSRDIDAASMDFFYGCYSADAGAAALNFSGYCNPEVDALVYEYWLNPDLEARWEPMYKAQKMMADDRPFITLAGVNSIQAYRSDRFEFPMGTCDVTFGMIDPESLIQVVVK